MKTNKIVLWGLAVGFLFAGVFTASTSMASTSGTLLPSADGTYSQWTPKNGTSTLHYTMVNDTVCDGRSTYNFTGTAGNRDSYKVNLASLPDGATITQINITPCASNNLVKSQNSTTTAMKVFYRFNGADGADGRKYGLLGVIPHNLAPTMFSGLSLTKSSSSVLEIGAVISSGTRGARLSRIAAVVTYTAPLTTPAAPSNLFAFASSSSSSLNVFLYWQDNSNNESGFNIERGIDSIRFTQIATSGVNVAFYTDSAVATGTTYYYRVRAFNDAGNSDYSNVVSTTVR